MIEERFEETVKTLINNGSIPVVFDDVPFLGSNDPKCPIKQEAFDKALNCVLPETANTFNIFFMDVISRVQMKYPQIIRITVADLICIDQECMRVLDGIPLYSDNDHLNYLGSQHLGEIYLRKYANPLKALAIASY